MKSKMKLILMIFAITGFIFSSCNKSEDLMTSDVKTGGLISPLSSIPYKLGNTPQVDIPIKIPKGPGIKSIKVFNKYYSKTDTAFSNEVLMKTISINNKNESALVNQILAVTYAELRTGLKVKGVDLPTDELLLGIGNYFTLKYICVMSDGSEVINNATTKISVANIYAGTYQCVGTFNHPVNGPRAINEEKFLTPLSAYTCNIPAGDLGASGYMVDITVNPLTNEVTFSNGVPVAMLPTAGLTSKYEPSTGKFYLYYFYVGSTGNRVIDEVYTPL